MFITDSHRLLKQILILFFVSAITGLSGCSGEPEEHKDTKTTQKEEAEKATPSKNDCLIIEHTVSDYNTWKVGFNHAESLRSRNGIHVKNILRDKDRPQKVYVLAAIDLIDDAKEYMSSPNTKRALEKAGVQSDLQLLWMYSSKPINKIRPDRGNVAVVSFNVADYGAWEESFEKQAARRDELGIEVIQTLRNVDNTNSVSVIMTVDNFEDVEKLSDSMEAKMAMLESGVISIPVMRLLSLIE